MEMCTQYSRPHSSVLFSPDVYIRFNGPSSRRSSPGVQPCVRHMTKGCGGPTMLLPERRRAGGARGCPRRTRADGAAVKGPVRGEAKKHREEWEPSSCLTRIATGTWHRTFPAVAETMTRMSTKVASTLSGKAKALLSSAQVFRRWPSVSEHEPENYSPVFCKTRCVRCVRCSPIYFRIRAVDTDMHVLCDPSS